VLDSVTADSYLASLLAGNDTIFGDGINQTLDGRAGNDIINAGDGNDTLIGGLGNDVMNGGDGSDTYHVDSNLDVVNETGTGTDQVFSSLSFALGATLEHLTLTGGTNANATGNGSSNVLVGNSGANVLDGRGGADQMTRGGGNDTYFVDDAGDTVSEDAGGGIDTVNSAFSFVLEDDLENLTLIGTANVNGTGNAFANVQMKGYAFERSTSVVTYGHITHIQNGFVFLMVYMRVHVISTLPLFLKHYISSCQCKSRRARLRSMIPNAGHPQS
jgi:Ca2+-binding RTX toxin-like protein